MVLIKFGGLPVEKSQTNTDIDNVTHKSIDIESLKKKNIDFDNDIALFRRVYNDNVEIGGKNES